MTHPDTQASDERLEYQDPAYHETSGNDLCPRCRQPLYEEQQDGEHFACRMQADDEEQLDRDVERVIEELAEALSDYRGTRRGGLESRETAAQVETISLCLRLLRATVNLCPVAVTAKEEK